MTVLFVATLASARVPLPDKVNVSKPTKLLNVKSLEAAVVVPLYVRVPDELNTRWLIWKLLAA